MQKEKKFNFIYVTTNLIDGKQYVGDHSCDNLEKDNYLGSGQPYFKNAIKTHKKENFKREILEFFPTKREAFDAQEKYIKQYNTLVPNGYNISSNGGYGVVGCALSKETKEKIRQSLLGKPFSEERKKKISISQKGKPKPWFKGKPKSESHRKKISEFQKGKKRSEETKKKMSEARMGKPKPWLKGKPTWNKGKPCSEETRKKIGNSNKGKPGSFKGKQHTEKTKNKISLSLTGKIQSQETIEKRKKSIGIPWNKGKKTGPLSKDHKNKIRESNKGKHGPKIKS